VATKSAAPTRASSAAVFVIRLRDQNGNRPSGIPVRFDGPVHLVVTSDATGAARLSGPQGQYAMRIDTGCHPSVSISEGARGTIHTVAGQTKDAEVHVTWRHRFAPSGSATSDAGGDWMVGTPVHIRYDVIDRCRDDMAPRASYPTFAFHTGTTVAVVGTPVMKADATGRGTVTVRCKAPGDAQVVLGDSRNPPDKVDLVGSAMSYGGRPRCVKS
jgi:hypothetical protein